VVGRGGGDEGRKRLEIVQHNSALSQTDRQITGSISAIVNLDALHSHRSQKNNRKDLTEP